MRKETEVRQGLIQSFRQVLRYRRLSNQSYFRGYLDDQRLYAQVASGQENNFRLLYWVLHPEKDERG